MSNELLKSVEAEWWSSVCLKGDPIRRSNLVFEAFEAGWRAAMDHIAREEREREMIDLADRARWSHERETL